MITQAKLLAVAANGHPELEESGRLVPGSGVGWTRIGHHIGHIPRERVCAADLWDCAHALSSNSAG
ncbi:hypothetical protein [Nocardia sp. 348MFTsu5.1]|uniref:hypothetical protein n=1 Tax=Nocardia sp. 348MFTsu5.1 TaxID=1172185 RepID=UPI0012DC82FF|nr:hypothetical protein [Nocardia sp. 348MFTsu5.1]